MTRSPGAGPEPRTPSERLPPGAHGPASSPEGVLLGTAGWSIPAEERERFGPGASHLVRYSTRLPAVEINSSFHRSHRRSTYARWAESVPASFRFSVKLPKTITHGARLRDANVLLDAFIAESSGLGERLGCYLVQLPPSLAFDVDVVEGFFSGLRERGGSPAVCEPRHPSWFDGEADATLAALGVARVAADPAPVAAAAGPGGWRGIAYFRLHGSPRTYYSTYPPAYVATLAETIRAEADAGRRVWCIFDNTVLGGATANALDLSERLAAARDTKERAGIP